MFILSTKTNGKTLIYQKPSAHRKDFPSIGLLLFLKIHSNITVIKREKNVFSPKINEDMENKISITNNNLPSTNGLNVFESIHVELLLITMFSFIRMLNIL